MFASTFYLEREPMSAAELPMRSELAAKRRRGWQR